MISHFYICNLETEKIMSYDVCVICSESDYNQNVFEKMHILTSCGHHFHNNCLSTWCLYNKSCPLCRRENIIALNNKKDKKDKIINNINTITNIININPNISNNLYQTYININK